MRELKIFKSITNRESESLEKYLQEIGKIELISPEMEVELARKIKTGDEKALQVLVKSNLRFVVSVAKQYQHNGLTLSDLINEGNIGLVKAARKFDETKGFKFISYAVWWIRQSIMKAIVENSRLIKLPLNKTGGINKVNRLISQLEQQFEREPTAEEISEVLKLSVKEVRLVLKNRVSSVKSLDAPIAIESDSSTDVTLHDLVKSDGLPDVGSEQTYSESLKTEVVRILDKLTPREYDVVTRLIGYEGKYPMSLSSVADELNLKSAERVRQIRDIAYRKLRVYAEEANMNEYLAQ